MGCEAKHGERGVQWRWRVLNESFGWRYGWLGRTHGLMSREPQLHDMMTCCGECLKKRPANRQWNLCEPPYCMALAVTTTCFKAIPQFTVMPLVLSCSERDLYGSCLVPIRKVHILQGMPCILGERRQCSWVFLVGYSASVALLP